MAEFTMTLTVKVTWWRTLYSYGLATMAAFTDSDTNRTRVKYWINRGVKVRATTGGRRQWERTSGAPDGECGQRLESAERPAALAATTGTQMSDAQVQVVAYWWEQYDSYAAKD